MYKSNRGSKTGGKKFGGGFSKKSDFHGKSSGRPELFDATCAGCNKRCQVPFRPNGSKPVYCMVCFRKNDYSDSKPSYRDGGSSRDSGTSESRSGSNELVDQLKVINSKLDAIMGALDV
jgi:CxxC-x17-CxxC domain-containing protein